MSTRPLKTHGRQLVLLLIVGIGLATTTVGQQLKAKITVVPETGFVTVEMSGAPKSAWSFRDTYAAVLGLGNRVEQFLALEEDGSEVPLRKIAPGQFTSTKAVTRVRYRMKLS